MTRKIIMAVALAAAVALGVVIGRGVPKDGDRAGAPEAGEREILYWVAPMDPNYRRDAPGKSPMGMDLVPVYADEAAAADPAVVAIDPTIVNNLGVRTSPVGRGPLSRRVDTVGYVGYDEDTLEHIHTRVDGWIERLAVKAAGDPIRRGQLLFELYSPTLVNAQQEYLAAKNSGNTVLLGASRERLAALGVTASEIARLDRERTTQQLISVFADTDGYVASLGVRQGIFVTPATDIMSIARLDQVWVLAEVFERQAAWVEEGQQAEVEFDYLPGRKWQGTVDYVYPELDAETRTYTVRLRFDNEDQVMRPNMFARITIYGTEKEPVLHVPREALIRGGAANRVVLALGEGRFRSQPVEVGIESGDRVEIRSGLRADDVVVTSGQFLIDSESNIESALARMEQAARDAAVESVRMRAIVRDVDRQAATVLLQHDPVPEWSWPAMTMSFDVVDAAMLDGLREGQPVDVTVENRGQGRYVVSRIAAAPAGNDEAADHADHDMPMQDEKPMDHSGHDMPMQDDEPMDHSGHDMSPHDAAALPDDDAGGTP